MNFLADANTPRLLVEMLTSSGHDVYWACDAAPRTPDLHLIEKARREQRLVVTFDKDFGALVFAQGHSAGVILIRLREATVEDTVSMVMDLIRSEGESLQGLFCVVEKNRIRKTPLP